MCVCLVNDYANTGVSVVNYYKDFADTVSGPDNLQDRIIYFTRLDCLLYTGLPTGPEYLRAVWQQKVRRIQSGPEYMYVHTHNRIT